MNQRINPFGDLSDFAPNSPKLENKDVIEKVAADNGFPSRQPAKDIEQPLRPRRRYTTGRNQQINIKATPETIERLYRIADATKKPLGEILEKALDALEKIS